jgi:hypothetical protein
MQQMMVQQQQQQQQQAQQPPQQQQQQPPQMVPQQKQAPGEHVTATRKIAIAHPRIIRSPGKLRTLTPHCIGITRTHD